MRLNFVRRAVHDVDSSAIGFPARDAGGKMFIGVGHAPVVLFLVFVFDCVRRRIAALPESFNELVAFFIVGEQLERLLLFIRDDPAYVFVEPLLVGLAQLHLQRLGILLFLLVGERTLEGIGFRVRL